MKQLVINVAKRATLPGNAVQVGRVEVVAREVDQVYVATSVTNSVTLHVNVRWRETVVITAIGLVILPKTVIRKLMKLESVIIVASLVISRETVPTLMEILKHATGVERKVMWPEIVPTKSKMTANVTIVVRLVTCPVTAPMNAPSAAVTVQMDVNATGAEKPDILLVIVPRKIPENLGRRIALVTTVVRLDICLEIALMKGDKQGLREGPRNVTNVGILIT